jgi:hypothetical protein
MSNYLDTTDAQTYFDGRLSTDAWDDASSADKTKALTMATRAIDALNFQGEKTVSTQEHQFPRGGDLTVPQEILDATCEVALSLLDGNTIDEAYQRSRISSERYATVGTTYNNDLPEIHVLNGIPSIVAWQLLKPFLRDPRAIAIDRA